jgi:hypothetical protein
MLKVLLAPELRDELLAAPRGRYRNASQLARAANVSTMSAFRFIQSLERHGYIDESAGYLNLVRREDLFRRWEASADRPPKEARVRLALGEPKAAVKRMAQSGRACLGLFAAAEELHLGFVKGVPPYVYVQRLTERSIADWKNLITVEQGDSYNLIVRQAPAPQSVFRGAVRVNDTLVTDVLQVWLDVSHHPSRGAEQAALIRRRIVGKLIAGGGSRG